MANSLLDFVMSVVRDPDAAAHYAANPAQAIADANLTDVTSADVNNLIPVVAESLSSVMPSGGAPGVLDSFDDPGGNVWASGAATAAFDAFDDHLPIQGADVIADHVHTVAGVIDQPGSSVIIDDFDEGLVPSVTTTADPYDSDAPMFDDVPFAEAPVDHPLDNQLDDGHQPLDDHPADSQDPGFDIFT